MTVTLTNKKMDIECASETSVSKEHFNLETEDCSRVGGW